MASEQTTAEQAVARALRANLETLQRTAEELNQAVADLVAACGSSRAVNALPPLVRAQTAAASLAAGLDVLSRFLSASLRAASAYEMQSEPVPVVSIPAPEPRAQPARPAPTIPMPMSAEVASAPVAPQGSTPEFKEPAAVETPVPAPSDADLLAALPTITFTESQDEAVELLDDEAAAETPALESWAAQGPFVVESLPQSEQEMHRRANRVAKVSMQDIQMLKPEHVRLGRENKDLCVRLRDEIEKAHREYERRFQPILNHPVDYFYHWMVEILAGGDASALGEYPYSSPVLRR